MCTRVMGGGEDYCSVGAVLLRKDITGLLVVPPYRLAVDLP